MNEDSDLIAQVEELAMGPRSPDGLMRLSIASLALELAKIARIFREKMERASE